jgi:hypothetical protein
MDRPWLWHWKKAFIFIPVQGLLIATGAIATASIGVVSSSSSAKCDFSAQHSGSRLARNRHRR